MKVYCVRHKQPQSTLKIFDSKEKAEDYIKKQNEEQKDWRFPLEYDIKEMEVE